MVTRKWLLALSPIGLLALLLLVSPNFQWHSDQPRQEPFGGDFLQEWIGGKIVLSENREELYDQQYVRQVQHDRDWIKFSWAEENYFPTVYPPFHYLLVSPLSRLEYRWATTVWAILSTLAFMATGVALYRYYPPARNRFPLLVLAATLFVPWIQCLSMGQKSGFLLLAFTATFLLAHHRHLFWAGVVFGLVAVKPQMGLVVGAMMLLHRQWLFAIGASATIGILSAWSWWIEPEWWTDYAAVIQGMSHYSETGGYRLSDSHNLWGGLPFLLPQLSIQQTQMIAGGAILTIAGYTVWSVWVPLSFHLGKNLKSENESRTFSLAFSQWMLATVLVSPHFYGYDLTILLLPLLLIVVRSGPLKTCELWLLGLAIAFYTLAGTFTKIAEATHIQISLPLLIAMFFLIPLASQPTD